MKMERLVDEAAEYSSEIGHPLADPKIVVVGCGGAGNNSIDRLQSIGVWGAETIAINTDRVHLSNIKADKRILIGKKVTKGRGAGGLIAGTQRTTCALFGGP